MLAEMYSYLFLFRKRIFKVHNNSDSVNHIYIYAFLIKVAISRCQLKGYYIL